MTHEVVDPRSVRASLEKREDIPANPYPPSRERLEDKPMYPWNTRDTLLYHKRT